MKKKILHCNEFFAKIGENYIFDQVNNNNTFESILVSEKHINSTYEPVDDNKRLFLRKLFNSNLVEKIFNRITLNIFERLYLLILSQYFLAKLKPLKSEISIIHAHFGHIAYKYIGLAKLLNVPMVVTFYGVDASACAVDPYWIKRLKVMFQYASVIIVLCESAKKSLISVGCKESKIIIWDIGIPIENYKYEPTLKLKENTVVRFLIVARFVEKKGYDVLLDAFKKLSQNESNISLTIVGYGPLKSKIKSKIEFLNLQEYINVIDTSEVSNFFEMFKYNLETHDLFVLPSIIASNGDDEGGPPIVITNAMAAGLPVISTPVGGIERAIIDNKTGFLVKPNDSDSLHEKMSYLCKHKSQWRVVSDAARLLVESNFNKEKQLEKINKIYSNLV